MNSSHKIILAASLFILSISACAADLSGEESWLFNSIYGQRLHIAYEQESLLYAVTLGDVTEKVQSCGNASLKLCIQSNTFDLAIPKEEPSVGKSWSINNTVYKIESRLENLQILNRTFEDVLVISVERDLRNFGENLGVKRFKFFYSYTDGLIFFKEISSQADSPLFISAQTPSIGS